MVGFRGSKGHVASEENFTLQFEASAGRNFFAKKTS